MVGNKHIKHFSLEGGKILLRGNTKRLLNE